jgi:hypothetical protein
MNKYLKVLIFAVIAGLGMRFLVAPMLNAIMGCESNTLSGNCLNAAGLNFIFYFILVPIIFGIYGYRSSDVGRFKHAIYYLLISLMVTIALIIPVIIYEKNKQEVRQAEELEELKVRYETNPEQFKVRPY